MLITRTSRHSGETRTLDIDVTLEQLDRYYKGGTLIQHAFPNITAAEREFIKTGITQEEWDEIFLPEDDDGGKL